MPFVLIDGFEDMSSWFTIAGTPSVTATGARHGNALSLPSGVATIWFPIPAALESATVTIGFAVKVTSVGTSISLLKLLSDATVTTHLNLVWTPPSGLYITRGGSTLVTTATGVVVPGTWYYVELQATLSDTVGAVTLRVNGVQVGTFSGDTKNAGTKTTFDGVFVEGIGGSGPSAMFDDLYLMAGASDSFQGDSIVDTLYPNGNGAVSAWVGSDADSTNNYLLVDETGTPVTTDYTGSPTAAAQDLYTMTDVVTVGTILGVCHQAYATKTDTGPKQFKLVNHRAADNRSPALDLTTSYAAYHYCLALDPETSAPWSTANVNALQSGVEVV